MLEVRGLKAGYGQVEVLHGIDLEVRDDEIVAVLGSNGAGKSTLNNNISSIFRPFAGSIVFAGEDITGARPEHIVESGIVQVPEGRRVFPNLTVRENLELARALATEPQMLLLDEVMAGLNAIEIDEIAGVIRDIRASGITILLIEHVMQAVMSLSDYTFVLNNGALISQGPPDRVAADVVVIEAYLGHGAAERIAQGGSRA